MSNRRNKRGSKVMDAQLMRAMIGSQQMTTSLGIVRKFSGETSHFDIDTENGTAEILVDVELIPSGERVLCRLGFGNDGIYKIPRADQEVAVLLPYPADSLIKDSLDYGAIIVGVLDTEAPVELDDDDIVVVKATRVHVISDDIKLGDTASDPIVRKSDLDAVISTVNSHTHLYAPGPNPPVATATALPQQAPVACSPVTKSK